nr:immunoglobulin light chain junction region [Macaca mulatta]MOV72382.1 immunoglobulin light chain junction region [Macaca mulatta]MOV72489.1 immunoglobulin light chain junction region [Macaca mulatta]MOV73207.1 immunoglobulin light chain junction region [Macaca mulatta]MOV73525.1 immunoglobulin light chain junction region [Macaca mulatta]
DYFCSVWDSSLTIYIF